MKSFTFGKRGIAMLSLVASLLLGGGKSCMGRLLYYWPKHN